MASYAETATSDERLEEDVAVELLNPKGKLQSKPVVLHNLPCRIHADGEAPVSDYFHVVVADPLSGPRSSASAMNTGAEKQYSASFRGRKLAGTKMDLPDKARGIVLSEKFAAGGTSSSSSSSSSSAAVVSGGGGGGSASGGVVHQVKQRSFEEVGHFQDLMHWDRDSVKGASQLDASLQWIHLARAVRLPSTDLLWQVRKCTSL